MGPVVFLTLMVLIMKYIPPDLDQNLILSADLHRKLTPFRKKYFLIFYQILFKYKLQFV